MADVMSRVSNAAGEPQTTQTTTAVNTGFRFELDVAKQRIKDFETTEHMVQRYQLENDYTKYKGRNNWNNNELFSRLKDNRSSANPVLASMSLPPRPASVPVSMFLNQSEWFGGRTAGNHNHINQSLARPTTAATFNNFSARVEQSMLATNGHHALWGDTNSTKAKPGTPAARQPVTEWTPWYDKHSRSCDLVPPRATSASPHTTTSTTTPTTATTPSKGSQQPKVGLGRTPYASTPNFTTQQLQQAPLKKLSHSHSHLPYHHPSYYHASMAHDDDDAAAAVDDPLNDPPLSLMIDDIPDPLWPKKDISQLNSRPSTALPAPFNKATIYTRPTSSSIFRPSSSRPRSAAQSTPVPPVLHPIQPSLHPANLPAAGISTTVPLNGKESKGEHSVIDNKAAVPSSTTVPSTGVRPVSAKKSKTGSASTTRNQEQATPNNTSKRASTAPTSTTRNYMITTTRTVGSSTTNNPPDVTLDDILTAPSSGGEGAAPTTPIHRYDNNNHSSSLSLDENSHSAAVALLRRQLSESSEFQPETRWEPKNNHNSPKMSLNGSLSDASRVMCTECKHKYFPGFSVCPKCLSSDRVTASSPNSASSSKSGSRANSARRQRVGSGKPKNAAATSPTANSSGSGLPPLPQPQTNKEKDKNNVSILYQTSSDAQQAADPTIITLTEASPTEENNDDNNSNNRASTCKKPAPLSRGDLEEEEEDEEPIYSASPQRQSSSPVGIQNGGTKQ